MIILMFAIKVMGYAMNENELNEYMKLCSKELNQKQNDIVKNYALGSYENWKYDQDTEKLTFLNQGKVILICDVIIIASWLEEKEDWLWGWANNSLSEDLRKKSERLKKLSTITGIEDFSEKHMQADKDLAEEIAAMSIKVLNAKGLYVAPAGKSQIFFAIISIRKI